MFCAVVVKSALKPADVVFQLSSRCKLFLNIHIHFLHLIALLPPMTSPQRETTVKRDLLRGMGAWMRISVITSAICLCLVSLCQADSAKASIRKLTNIPAEELAPALQALAKDYDFQVLYRTEIVSNLRTQGAVGTLTPDEALGKVLSGTGLTFKYLDDKTVTIVTSSVTGSMPSTTQNASSGSTDNTSSNKEVGKKSSQEFRVAQLDQNAVGPQTIKNSGEKDEGLAEIIVTAQKREERLLDVPISIVALTGKDLEQRGVTSILDLPLVVPDLAIYDTGASRSFEIRGVSNFTGSSTAVVGMYIDEADATVSTGTAMDVSTLYDLERIEVLRGPQGTLYGEGSAGGTIRFVTKNPDPNRLEMNADVSASFTQDGAPSERINAMLNVPLLPDELGLRFVGTFARDGGWIDQPSAAAKDINGRDVSDIRAKGLWQPEAQLRVSAMVDISRSDGGTGIGEDANGNFTQPFSLTTAPRTEINHDLYNLTVSYDFSSFQVLNTTTYFDEMNNSTNLSGYTQDTAPPALPDYYYIPSFSVTEHIWTDEFRLTSIGSGRWKWTLGALYRHDQYNLDEPSYYFGPPGPLPPDDGPSQINNRATSWSTFGDTSYRLTERLTLGAGVRYFHDSLNYSANYLPIVQTGTFHSVDPRFYLEAKLAEGINLYTSAAKGFRSGGFSYPGPGVPPSFGPESIWTYELGAKMLLSGGRLSLDASVFYTNYSDYQTSGISTQLGGVPGTFNAGDARIKGVEWNFGWRPTDSWELNLSGDYLDDKFTEINVTQTTHAVGDRLDFVPRYQFVASGQRNFSCTGRPCFVRLDYSEQGPQVLKNLTIGPWFYGESDTIRSLNFRTGMRVTNSVQLALVAQNLTNDRGFLNPDHIEGLSPRARPRTYGMEFIASFE
jgi:iron complex outermembrane recepter protein